MTADKARVAPAAPDAFEDPSTTTATHNGVMGAVASPRAEDRVPTRRQHVLGIVLILTVACIWVFSAEFIQYIFGESHFNKSYFLTYISTSAFSVFLLGFLRPSWRAALRQPPPTVDPLAYEALQSTPATAVAPGGAPGGGGERGGPGASAAPVLRFPPSYVFAVGAQLAGPFFLANWTNNMGLQLTSVASSSTIATLTALFTLIIGAVTGVERFTPTKLVAALCSIGGVALIFAFDKTAKVPQPGAKPVLGDALSILSAVVYAAYSVFLKARAGPEGALNMSMMLGFMGAVSAVALSPGFALLHVSKLETFELPSPRVAVLLLVNALVGTVLSDYLWATSVVLTSPLVTSLSLSLTVPLSIFTDFAVRHERFGWSYILGALLVFLGFVLGNVEVSARRSSETAPTDGAAHPTDSLVRSPESSP